MRLLTVVDSIILGAFSNRALMILHTSVLTNLHRSSFHSDVLTQGYRVTVFFVCFFFFLQSGHEKTVPMAHICMGA